jgi:pantothenate kinase type III
MTSLVIDIGNTYTKIAVFNRYELLHNEQYKAIDAALIIKLMNDYPVNKAIISSVKKKTSKRGKTYWLKKLSFSILMRPWQRGLLTIT